jgi:predicted aminopeptidase
LNARVYFSRLGWLLTFALCMTGCQTVSYYSQAIHGQCQMWNRQRSIQSLLDDPGTPDDLKQRLRFVLEVRTFAQKELQLPANGHYLRYADLGRPFAVWNVYAAPELSIKPKAWRYPFVGRLEYRGFFSEEKARRYAATLEKEHYDVFVGGVTAYSTLGWFHDPVLNTFIHDEDDELAGLLFHELAHQRVFVSGDTDFNEAFATAVAGEGLRRWIESRRDAASLEKHRAEFRRTEQFVTLVAETRKKLEAVYDATPGPSAAPTAKTASDTAKRQEKQRIIEAMRLDYARLKAEWGGRTDYDEWFDRRPNNAQLNTVDAYYHLVPAFRRLLEENGGNLEAFYGAATALGKLKKSERELNLDRLRQAGR